MHHVLLVQDIFKPIYHSSNMPSFHTLHGCSAKKPHPHLQDLWGQEGRFICTKLWYQILGIYFFLKIKLHM